MVAVVLVKLALFAPLFVKVTSPEMALFCVKVMALAPALKVAVPGTVKTPVCIIAPPAVMLMSPPAARLSVGNAIAALL